MERKILVLISLIVLSLLCLSLFVWNISIAVEEVSVSRIKGLNLIAGINSADFYGTILCIGETLGNGNACRWSVDCMMINSSLRHDHFDVAGECLKRELSKNLLTVDVESLSEFVKQSNLTNSSLPTVWASFSVMGQKSMMLNNIIYHHLLGIQKFIVFDESEHMKPLLLPFIRTGLVIYFAANPKTQNFCQIKAIEFARKHNVDFLGLIDVDEFVVLNDTDTIPDMLSRVSVHQSVVSLPWVLINASDGTSRDTLSPLFDICPQLDCGSLDKHVKSFVRPAAVELIESDPHSKIPFSGTFQGLPSGTRFGPAPFWVESLEGKIYNGPVMYHFHFKRLDLYISKRALGTGDVIRTSDFFPMWSWIEDFNNFARDFTCSWKREGILPSVFPNASQWSSKIITHTKTE